MFHRGKQGLMELSLLAMGVALALLVMHEIRQGSWLAVVLLTWVSSIGAMSLAALFEHWRSHGQSDSIRRLYDVSYQSWAFLFGDQMGLAFALATGARSRQGLPSHAWYQTPGWMWASLALGVVGTLIFHWSDRKNYIKRNALEAKYSPVHYTHDAVTFLTLCSGLFYAGVPLLWERHWLQLVLLLIGIAFWAMLGVRDVHYGVMTRERHWGWDMQTLRPRPLLGT